MRGVEEVERVLPFAPIDDAMAGSKEVANFKGVELNPSAASTKSEISAIVDDWRTLNPNSPLFKDVPAGETWGGSPARPVKQWMRETAWLIRMAGRREGKGS